MTGRMKTERKIAVAKDLILFMGGLSGIAYQQVTGDVHYLLLVIFTAMTGVPGLTNIISLLKTTPSVLESSSPQQSQQESVSGNSSPSSSEVNP